MLKWSRWLVKGFFLVFTFYFVTSFNTKQEQTILVSENHTPDVNTIRKVEFEQSMKSFYNSMEGESYGLNYDSFNYAMVGYLSLLDQNKINNENYLSIIDFTKPSNEKRFYTIDLDQKKIIYHTYVAHGSNTGMVFASKFSDKPNSHQSSLGFYITGKTYVGSKGFSLKLHGDEYGYNKNMYERAVVIHTANYVSESVANTQGRLGRSWGCPVLPENVYKPIINTIKNGSVIFAYYNDKTYLNSSKYLDMEKAIRFLNTKNHKYFSA